MGQQKSKEADLDTAVEEIRCEQNEIDLISKLTHCKCDVLHNGILVFLMAWRVAHLNLVDRKTTELIHQVFQEISSTNVDDDRIDYEVSGRGARAYSHGDRNLRRPWE